MFASCLEVTLTECEYTGVLLLFQAAFDVISHTADTQSQPLFDDLSLQATELCDVLLTRLDVEIDVVTFEAMARCLCKLCEVDILQSLLLHMSQQK